MPVVVPSGDADQAVATDADGSNDGIAITPFDDDGNAGDGDGNDDDDDNDGGNNDDGNNDDDDKLLILLERIRFGIGCRGLPC